MPNKKSEDLQVGKHAVPAFSPAVDAGTANLTGIPEAKVSPAGEILLAQGESPQFARLIRSGIVRLFYTDENGVETTLGLRSEGWWVGGTIAFLGFPSLCSIEAVTNCKLSSVPAATFSDTVRNNPQLLSHFLLTQCREHLMFQQHQIVQRGSAMERLRYLEGEGTESVWTTANPNQVLRQGEVAKLLSITPEHLSRLKRKKSPSC